MSRILMTRLQSAKIEFGISGIDAGVSLDTGIVKTPPYSGATPAAGAKPKIIKTRPSSVATPATGAKPKIIKTRPSSGATPATGAKPKIIKTRPYSGAIPATGLKPKITKARTYSGATPATGAKPKRIKTERYSGATPSTGAIPRSNRARAIISKKIKLTRLEKRMFMLHHFDMGHTVKETVNILTATYGKVVTDKTCGKWFARFRVSRSCNDNKRSGRPRAIKDVELLRDDIESNAKQSTRSMGVKYKCSAPTVMRCLHMLNYVCRRMGYHPYKANEDILRRRATMADALMKQNLDEHTVARLVTCDESKILMFNPYRGKHWIKKGSRAQTIPKACPSAKWFMLCVFWNRDGIIHRELLDTGETVDRNRYQKQLGVVAKNLKLTSTDTVPLLHDNAPCHRARETIERAEDLGFQVLQHPPYSPDLSPTDYHLFRSLSNTLRNTQFTTKQELLARIDEYFDSKPKSFYAHGIDALPARWSRIVESEGKYCL